MEAKESDFLKPVEVSRALNISRSKLYEALASGEIPSCRIAGLTRIPRRWIDEQIKKAIAANRENGEPR